MIRNAKQYCITKMQAEKFRRALNEFDERPAVRADVHPKLIEAQREAIAGQLKDLERELNEYEQLAATRQ